MALKEARERHFASRQKLATGSDPMVERQVEAATRQREAEEREREAANSFENVARKLWEMVDTKSATCCATRAPKKPAFGKGEYTQVRNIDAPTNRLTGGYRPSSHAIVHHRRRCPS
jgi:hypothetical protein